MDKNVQALLVSEILKHYPNDAIFAEEGQLKEDIEVGSVWVIDPIDGTANFVAQGYDFAVMVAYYENGIGPVSYTHLGQGSTGLGKPIGYLTP